MSPSSPAAAPAADHPALAAAVLDSFRGSLRPVAIAPGYRIGLLLVAALMVLLPLVYLGLIAGAGWGVYWHATHNTWIFQSLRGKTAALAYGAPLFAGVVLVFFMVKPLFAPRGSRPAVRSLRRADEPRLFAFVERVAATVGAPAPRRIDVDCQVNAAASFRRGLLSMAGNDLVLTLGLPLVSGLSLAQLAGVLAHELGHFAQGAGMRLTYVIRAVNWWFVRVVHERDRWDEQLAQTRRQSGFLLLTAAVGLAEIVVWLTRRILAGLMWVGHTASCYLLRQMEYDADRYEARLVGAEVFTSTVYELSRLSVAQQQALGDVGTYWREGRLPDDLPGLVALNRGQLDAGLLARVDAHVNEARTGRFDTHPADPDRIASAARERDAPVFASELPAAALFRDLPAVARAASLDFYRAQVGERAEGVQLQEIAALAGRKQAEAEEAAALARFCGPLANPLRPLPLPASIAPPAETSAAVAELRELHALLAPRGEALAAAWRSYDDHDTTLLRCAQARALLAVGYRPRRERQGLTSEEETAAAEAEARAAMGELGATLSAGETACARRLGAALALAVGAEHSGAEHHREVTALLAAARAIASQLGPLVTIRDGRACLGALAGELSEEGEGGDQALHRALALWFARVRDQVAELRAALAAVEYPFEHAGGRRSLADFAVPDLQDGDGLGALFDVVGEAMANLYGVYFRALGRLAVLAERGERSAGLEPMAMPQPPPPP